MARKFILWAILLLVIGAGLVISRNRKKGPGDDFVAYTIDPKTQHLQLFWKNEKGARYGSLGNLKHALEKRKLKLAFAMNGGMFDPSYAPQGLYIEQGRVLSPLDTAAGEGNFYLKPNGVFYLTHDLMAAVCETAAFRDSGQIRYATQSGPMLLINGAVHPAFKKRSAHLNIRNGVGILPGNRILFAMSKKEISFYHFAEFFKSQGCVNALYLDGLVSRTYLPRQQWLQTDGDFGAIIAVTEKLQD